MKIIVAGTESSDLYADPAEEAIAIVTTDEAHFADIGLKDGDEVKIRLGDDRVGYLLVTRWGGELHLTRVVYKVKVRGCGPLE